MNKTNKTQSRALIERLIRILDEELFPTKNKFLSGRLGVLVTEISGGYFITLVSKENLLLTVERLQHLKQHLEVDPFKDMDISVYLDEITELRDRNLWVVQFHIFAGEKEET